MGVMLTLPHQKLIKYLDDSIKIQKYGTLTLTVIVKNGIPIPESAKIVQMKRKKYPKPKLDSPIRNLI